MSHDDSVSQFSDDTAFRRKHLGKRPRALSYDTSEAPARVLVPETPRPADVDLTYDSDEPAPEPAPAPTEPEPASATGGRYYGFTLHRPTQRVDAALVEPADRANLDPGVQPVDEVHADDREPPYQPCTGGDYAWMLLAFNLIIAAVNRAGKLRVRWAIAHHEHSTEQSREFAAGALAPRSAPSPHLQGLVYLNNAAPVGTVRKWLQQLGAPGCSGMHVKAYRADEAEHALRYVKDAAYVPGGSHETAKPSSYLFEHGDIPDYNACGTQGKRTDLDEALDLYAEGKTLVQLRAAGIKAQTLVQTVKVGPMLYSQIVQHRKPALSRVIDLYGPPGSGKTEKVLMMTDETKTAFVRGDSNWMGCITPNVTTLVFDDFCGHQPFKALMSLLCGTVPTQLFGKGTEFYAPQIERIFFTSLHGFAYYYTQDNQTHVNGTTAEIEKQCADRITDTFTPDPNEQYKFIRVQNPTARCRNKVVHDNVERDE